MPESKKRFETLDALRGVAAFAVVLFHLTEVKLEHTLMPHGYLAVDFFFVLSGFVIAHAYERALGEGMSVTTFMLKRAIRLYPLATAGAVAGFVLLMLKWLSFPARVDSLVQIVLSGALNSLLLPTFWGGAASHRVLFPGNGPLWSLFFEMAFNLVWAAFLVRRATSILGGVAIISGFALIGLTVVNGSENLGFDPVTFVGGAARVSFGFIVGVLIYRFRGRLRTPSFAGAPWFLVVGLLAVFVLPSHTNTTKMVYDLACAFVILPFIVVTGVSQASLGPLGRLSGDLSYPVYALHYPILLLASGLHQTRLFWVNTHVMSVGTIFAVLGLSWSALRFFDEPLRERLSAKLRRSGVSEVVREREIRI